ncbi:MAG: sigma-54-dependent Fis family transcriptional regulator [Planctomycetes bacterium]|nr:sigma-54-dependent Fis family transcriptional regulator [Planctomycetota bacterium]
MAATAGTILASERPREAALALLVVEDDAEFRENLAALLDRNGFAVTAVESCAAARAALAKGSFDALFADIELPDGDGSALLDDAGGGATELVVITGHATVASAVDALKGGALDYLTKPIDLTKLKSTLAHLRRNHALKREVVDLRLELLAQRGGDPIVASSRAMQVVFEQVARIAPSDASVLISGESGTGKEVIAQAIHESSRRAAGKMIAVNCGAIPETLIESELFGHERGSFTGADKLRRGFFERADGGTLFLDEITEMPLQAQVKLLRVLESGRLQRLGAPDELAVSVRVIAATNRDPAAAIRDGRLREDLYFRLAVFTLHLPPLRERRADIAPLARHFLDLLNRTYGVRKEWAAGALERLEERAWNGNVRELKNAVHRAWILGDSTLEAESAQAGAALLPAVGASFAISVGDSIADAEQQLIVATLEHAHGDKPAAAKLLGISLKTLYNRLSVYRAAAP